MATPQEEEILKEAASEALTKNISDLTEALSGNAFQDIVLACEQKKLIKSKFKRNLLNELAAKSSKAADLVSEMQSNVSFRPDCLDTFLCILTQHGGIPGTTVAEAIAKDYGHTLPNYERSLVPIANAHHHPSIEGVTTIYSIAKMVVFGCIVLTLLITASTCIFMYMNYEGSGFKAPLDVNSEIVQKAMKDISLTLDLEGIAEDFNITARYLQIAYNGLVVRPKLQGEVKDLQIEVLKIFKRSKVAFNDFAQTSTKVLSLLEFTYYFLYNKKVKIAQETFASVSDKANKMSDTAKATEISFENIGTIRNFLFELLETYKTNHRKNSKNKLDMEVKLRRLEAKEIGTLKKFELMEELFNDARQKEDKAIEDQTNPWKELINGLANSLGVEVFNMGVYKDAVIEYRKEKEKYFEKMEKLLDDSDQTRENITELIQRVRNSQTESELSDIAIKALRDVVFALSQVAMIMQNVMNYWDKMHHVINDMKESKFLDLAMKDFPLEKRNEVLYSDFFQEEMSQNYAKWTAFQVICSDFSIHIMEPAITMLQQVVNERPLSETESLAKARQIASELDSDMKYFHKRKDEL